jgi:UBX domain-containing protein 1
LKNFKGTGYVLGSDEKDSELAVGDSEDDSAESQFITITFWQSGFQIDNGKFRSNADPQNAAFLEDVKSGVAPRELQERLIGRKGGTVNLKIVDRRHEDFKPNKLAPKPFAGRGHMLGSPAPALVTEATADSLKLQEHVPKVDTNKETTFIQVRLADGTRVEVEMNYDHTVGQLRDFVRATSNVTGPFKLMTSFPLKELSDDSQTISEAGLLKAVVIQKFHFIW